MGATWSAFLSACWPAAWACCPCRCWGIAGAGWAWCKRCSLLQDIPRLEIPLHTLIELVPKPDGKMAEERIHLDVVHETIKKVPQWPHQLLHPCPSAALATVVHADLDMPLSACMELSGRRFRADAGQPCSSDRQWEVVKSGSQRVLCVQQVTITPHQHQLLDINFC